MTAVRADRTNRCNTVELLLRLSKFLGWAVWVAKGQVNEVQQVLASSSTEPGEFQPLKVSSNSTDIIHPNTFFDPIASAYEA